MTAPTDCRLLCQCKVNAPSTGPDWLPCEYRATAEDMLCGTCRTGCTSVAFLAAEDISIHMAPGSAINWDDLDGDLP